TCEQWYPEDGFLRPVCIENEKNLPVPGREWPGVRGDRFPYRLIGLWMKIGEFPLKLRNMARWAMMTSLILLAGCTDHSTGASGGDSDDSKLLTLKIVAGSENKTLQPLIDRFARDNNVKIDVNYRGSVDIMLLLEGGQVEYDAVWPANSLWI